MKTPSEGPSGFNNEQANRGGADAVEKTSYVTGHGGSPGGEPPADADAVPAVRTSSALGAGTWVLLALAFAVLLYFGGALFG
ncbi:MAG TPA: hypothetical protein VK922_07725 [Gemmatimonadaceae bacterium]|nr:hypothetical protein [Gemmatimonadaceae bacterium]